MDDIDKVWRLKSCWLESSSTVNKLLREGFEPFWGYRVVIDGKPKVRMYFRKAPQLAITELKESGPIGFDLEPLTEFSNQFRSLLSGLLDDFTDRFFKRLEVLEYSKVISLESGHTDLDPEAVKKLTEVMDDVEHPVEQLQKDLEVIKETGDTLSSMVNIERYLEENTKDQLVEMACARIPNSNPETFRRMTKLEVAQIIYSSTPQSVSEGRESPEGDGFRVVKDDEQIPVVTTVERTPQQDATLESLKKQHGNISILPGSEGGALRVMVGADIYKIGPSGNFTIGQTGANTRALG